MNSFIISCQRESLYLKMKFFSSFCIKYITCTTLNFQCCISNAFKWYLRATWYFMQGKISHSIAKALRDGQIVETQSPCNTHPSWSGLILHFNYKIIAHYLHDVNKGYFFTTLTFFPSLFVFVHIILLQKSSKRTENLGAYFHLIAATTFY